MNKFFILMTLCCAITACSNQRIPLIPSYKLQINQGNELDKEAVSALQTGMTRQQVQMLLGTPLLADPFHADRWDYVYVITRNGKVKQQSSLTVYFDGDNVRKIEGDALQVARENEEQTQ